MLAAFAALPARADITTGLTGHWMFDDGSGTTAVDSIAAANGTLTGGPTWTTGRTNGAINLDGVNDYVDVATISLTATSVAFWIYLPTDITSSTTGQAVFRYGGDSVQNTVCIGSCVSGLSAETITILNGSNGRTGISTTLARGWRHIALVWNSGASRYDIYLDGIANTTYTGAGPPNHSGQMSVTRLQIGGTTGTASFDEFVTGVIDDFRIYNRSLSATDVATLAWRPLGWWKLDDASGTTAADTVSNAHPATLTNGPTWTTGTYGGALTFDGVDDYVSIGDTGAQPVRTSLWVNLPGAITGASTCSALLRYGSGSATEESVTLGDCSGTDTGETLMIWAPDNGMAQKQRTFITDTLAAGWHYLVLQWNAGSSRYDVYVDSTAMTVNPSSDGVHVPLMTYGNFILGASPGSTHANAYFTGAIDDVRMAPTTLTSTEIASVAQRKRYWIGSSSATLATDGGWSLSDGGENNTEAPTTTDTVVFSSASASVTLSSAVTYGGMHLTSTFAGTLTRTATITIGDLTQDGGTFTGAGVVAVTGTMTVSGGTYQATTGATTVTAAATMTGGTYRTGTGNQTFNGGLTVGNGATFRMDGSAGRVFVGAGTTATFGGLFQVDTLGTVPAIEVSGSGYYTLLVTSTGSLNIAGLKIRDTQGYGLDIANGATFTQLRRLEFTTGTGSAYMRIASNSINVAIPGCTFDAGTTANVVAVGNGDADGRTLVFLENRGGSSGAGVGESRDVDDDSNGDNVAENPTTNGALVQWVRTANPLVGGSIEGFPTAAFDWTTFTYYATYAAFRDVSAGTDVVYRLSVDGDGSSGWSLPSGVGDLLGTPRWDTIGGSHYVFVVTTLGRVYRLIDNGSSLALDGAWTTNPYFQGGSATGTSPVVDDSSRVVWAGADSSGNPRLFFLNQVDGTLLGTTPVTGTITVAPSLATISSVPYVFFGTGGHVYKVDATSQVVIDDVTSLTDALTGRIAVHANRLYATDEVGKVWALNAASSGLPVVWSYQPTKPGGGACDAATCRIGSFYAQLADFATPRVYWGDKSGRLFVAGDGGSGTGSVLSGYPYTTGTGVISTAPLYANGIIVVGNDDGEVFVINQTTVSGGGTPALLSRYAFGSAVSSIARSPTASSGSGAYTVGTASGKIFYVTRTTDPDSYR